MKKFLPFSESRLHDSILDFESRSCEQILHVILVLCWNKCQELFCGGGKRFEYEQRNFVRSFVCSRDAMSAIVLYEPDMWSIASNPALQ